MAEPQFQRNIAYKYRLGQLIQGKPIMEADKLKHLDLDNKKVVRVNIVANVVDKYVQEGEKKFGSITLDDGSGQIKAKTFGEDVEKFFAHLNQGDTVLVIGLLRSWNNEVYITPEIIKKQDPQYLLVRKLELDADAPKTLKKEEISALKDSILTLIKDAEKDNGIDVDKIIMQLKEPPELINKEIKRLLEDGLIYEPRPGKLRWLG
ncbi:MAG: OB-fold nucleic acid binding domain-containing protein [archaeon]